MTQETNPTDQAATPTRENAATTASTYPSQHGHRLAAAAQYPATLVPEAGWHFLHLFYRIDRGALAQLPSKGATAREALVRILDRSSPGAPEQMQCFAVPGHKADFGIM